NAQAAKDRKTGILECRELAGKLDDLFLLDAADAADALALAAGCLTCGGRPGSLLAAFLLEARRVVAKAADLGERVLCGLRFDLVLDLLAGLVHRLILERRHPSDSFG